MPEHLQQYKPKILIAGPIIIDAKSSGGEGEKLYQALRSEGFIVHKRSGHRNKILRLASTTWFQLSSASKYDVAILLVFSGYGAFLYNMLCALLCRLTGKPLIAVIHGGAYHEFYSKAPFLSKLLFKNCYKACSPSMFLKKFFTDHHVNVEYLPNFISNAYFTRPEKRAFRFSLVWVRAFHKIYNPEMAIQVMKNLVSRYPGVSLTMVGSDRGEMQACKNLAQEFGLDRHITFSGFVPNNKLNDVLHRHDIYINTTQYESFGIANMEAALTGLPVVSTAAGEIPYLWENEKNILLADKNDPDMMSKQISRLFDSEEKRAQLSEEGYRHANSFLWPQVYPYWLRLFNQIKPSLSTK